MKTQSRIQKHPHQEDKSGRPQYASSNKINSSTNDPRSNAEDDDAPEEHKKQNTRLRPKRQK